MIWKTHVCVCPCETSFLKVNPNKPKKANSDPLSMMMLKIPEVGGSLLFYFCENKKKKLTKMKVTIVFLCIDLYLSDLEENNSVDVCRLNFKFSVKWITIKTLTKFYVFKKDTCCLNWGREVTMGSLVNVPSAHSFVLTTTSGRLLFESSLKLFRRDDADQTCSVFPSVSC